MKLALTFPGQGSQYVGMGKDLYDNFTAAKKVFEEANDVLGFDIKALCFEGPDEELKVTSNTQPAILTVSMAGWMALMEHGFMPTVVAGHSLGEYSALVAAEALSFSDALVLVRKRGTFMQESAGEGGMAAILGLERDLISKACHETSALGAGVVEVANFNCPGQIVIAGEGGALVKAMDLCKQFGAKRVIELQVSGPFHSSLMLDAGRKLAGVLEGTDLRDPVCPLISNVTADAVHSAADIRNLLVQQVSNSVRWEESIRNIYSMGIETCIEIGPGKVLTGLGKKIVKEIKYLNVEDKSTLEITLDNLKEVL